jgi:hypothetical protein
MNWMKWTFSPDPAARMRAPGSTGLARAMAETGVDQSRIFVAIAAALPVSVDGSLKAGLLNTGGHATTLAVFVKKSRDHRAGKAVFGAGKSLSPSGRMV